MTRAYKKLMIQPDKALDFIKKCDALHRNKVTTEQHLSGSTNFDNDESYGLIRVDQIDEISPKVPAVRKDAREDQDLVQQNHLMDGQYNMPRQVSFHNMAVQ